MAEGVPEVDVRVETDSINNNANDSITVDLGRGTTIRTASAVMPDTAGPPLRAVIYFGTNQGNVIPLVSGWIRSPDTPIGFGGLTWHGEIVTPRQHNSILWLTVRNDTGAAQTYQLRWTEE